MSYQVKTVSNHWQMRVFVKFPFQVYDNYPYWIPPLVSEINRTLDVKKNPYFQKTERELFLCYKDHKVCARVAIIRNPLYTKKFKKNTAFFGFFDSFNDPAAVNCLFNSVSQYCKKHEIDSIEGPFNPNHYSELGLLQNKYDELPAFFQPYNPSYYHDLLKSGGFHVLAQLHTRKNPDIQPYINKLYGRKKLRTQIDGFSIRPFRKNHFHFELECIREVFNDAFSENWHFLPLTHEEYLFSAKYLKWITYPHLIQIVEYQGQPVGVVQCVLDINPLLKLMHGKNSPIQFIHFIIKRKKLTNLIIYAVGVKKSYHYTPAFQLIFNTTVNLARNYKSLETSWMMKNNHALIGVCNRLGLQPDKSFSIYEKDLRRE